MKKAYSYFKKSIDRDHTCYNETSLAPLLTTNGGDN